MKLFKKLAAAALAAVLALSMVGCGAGGTGSALELKNEVLNMIEDTYYLNGKYNEDGRTATHTTAMDAAAAKLIEGAAEDGAEEGNGDTVKTLLKNQTIEGGGSYIAIVMPYTQLSTELMQQVYIAKMEETLDDAIEYIADEDYYNTNNTIFKIGVPEIRGGDSIEIGAATGKIKDKNYLVLLVKKAA